MRRHLAAIPAIEQAAAGMFAAADLPLELRYTITDFDLLQAAQDDGRLWVAVDESGQPVGFALAGWLGDDAVLDEIDVMPRCGRRGIGTALVRAAIDWARGSGESSLSLLTFRHLPWNAPFYARLGFRILGKSELSPAMHERFAAERNAGIDIRRRVAMRLALD